MQADRDGREIVTVACRFVPYDQWFVTHLRNTWQIKQVKEWILSRCNLIQPPETPVHRPVSPITFASTRTRSSLDGSDWSDDELDDDSEDLEDFPGRPQERRHNSLYSRQIKTSFSSMSTSQAGVSATDMYTPSRGGSNDSIMERYTLLSFTTGRILEDKFNLSWYKLRPYELLEMHRFGTIVTLPRSIPAEYAQPYFESNIREMRPARSPRSGRFDPPVAESVSAESAGGKGKERASGKQDASAAHKKKQRKKIGWRDRWLVIYQGMLNVYKDRTSGTLIRRFPLSGLLALRGAESLEPHSTSIGEQRIVCILFRSQLDPTFLGSSPSISVPSSPLADNHDIPERFAMSPPIPDIKDSGVLHTDIREHEPGGSGAASTSGVDSPEDSPRLEGHWLVLDMLDDQAFSNLLRILHRLAPQPISSSFLPSVITLASITNYWNKVSSPAMTPHVYSSPQDTLPYPEWRTEIVETARRAGMGDVGRPVAWILWSETVSGDALTASIRRRRRAARQEQADNDWYNTASSSSAASHSMAGESDGDDADDGESEAEWEGWMRDLDRQGKARQHRPPSVASQSSHSSIAGLSLSPRGSSAGLSAHTTPPPGMLAPTRTHKGRTPSLTLPRSVTTPMSLHHAVASQSFQSNLSMHPPLPEDSCVTRIPTPIETTTVSTVTVGSRSSPNRRRSSTVTPGTINKLPRDKDRAAEGPPSSSAGGSNRSVSHSSHVRHAHSGSNLRSYYDRRNAENDDSVTLRFEGPDPEHAVNGGKKRKNGLRIVRGMSMRAEQLVRGLDSALDFVEGKS